MPTREVALADLALGQAVERDQHVIGELLFGQLARDGRQRGDEAGLRVERGQHVERRDVPALGGGAIHRFECGAGAGARVLREERHDGDALDVRVGESRDGRVDRRVRRSASRVPRPSRRRATCEVRRAARGRSRSAASPRASRPSRRLRPSGAGGTAGSRDSRAARGRAPACRARAGRRGTRAGSGAPRAASAHRASRDSPAARRVAPSPIPHPHSPAAPPPRGQHSDRGERGRSWNVTG